MQKHVRPSDEPVQCKWSTGHLWIGGASCQSCFVRGLCLVHPFWKPKSWWLLTIEVHLFQIDCKNNSLVELSISPSLIEVWLTNKVVRYLRCTMRWFDRHCERVPCIKLITTSIISNIYLFLWECLRSLSKFQLYDTVLSTILTMLYIRSSDLIHPTAKRTWGSGYNAHSDSVDTGWDPRFCITHKLQVDACWSHGLRTTNWASSI